MNPVKKPTPEEKRPSKVFPDELGLATPTRRACQHCGYLLGAQNPGHVCYLCAFTEDPAPIRKRYAMGPVKTSYVIRSHPADEPPPPDEP